MDAKNHFHNPDTDEYVFILLADKNGTIVSMNDLLCNDCEYDLGEIIGQPFHILFHPEIQPVIKEVLNTVKYGKTWEGYLKRLTKSGELFWIHAKISPIGQDSGFISCCRKALDEEITKITSLSKTTL